MHDPRLIDHSVILMGARGEQQHEWLSQMTLPIWRGQGTPASTSRGAIQQRRLVASSTAAALMSLLAAVPVRVADEEVAPESSMLLPRSRA
jgi:hypothetical protein